MDKLKIGGKILTSLCGEIFKIGIIESFDKLSKDRSDDIVELYRIKVLFEDERSFHNHNKENYYIVDKNGISIYNSNNVLI